MHNYVQILGTPTWDTPGASLMLHFPNRRYLFGRIGEGTQRLMVQRKMSMSKVENIFLSGTINWLNAGGLLGMLLTIADVQTTSKASADEAKRVKKAKAKARGKEVEDEDLGGNPSALSVHGGKNLTHMLASARYFIYRRGFPVQPHEVRTDPRAENSARSVPDWEDENIRVWAVPVTCASYHSRSPRDTQAEDEDTLDHQDDGDGPEPKRRRYSAEDDAETEEIEHGIREGVVKSMFNKNRIDSLKAMRLPDVKLPATIYVRGPDRKILPYEGPRPGDPDCPDIPVLVKDETPAATVNWLPRTKLANDSICYIVKCQPRRGRFNPQKAVALGVAKEDYKKLTSKQSVTGKDGQIVTPEMVLDPDIPGHGFALVDIQRERWVDPFLARPEWSNPEIMEGIDAIYWFLDDRLEVDPRITSFIRKHRDRRHIFISHFTCANHINFESAAAQTIMMNGVDPERFPLPNYYNKTKMPREIAELFLETDVGKPGASMQLAPQVTFEDFNAIVPMDTVAPIQELQKKPEVFALVGTAQKQIEDPRVATRMEEIQKDTPSRDAEVYTIGTGSALPSKYRNVSATLIRVPGYGSYLFDCGENTLGQLRRICGAEGLKEILKDLRGIFISHLHADHHLGTLSVLHAWRRLVHPRDYKGSPRFQKETRRLLIVANSNFNDWLLEVSDVCHIAGKYLVKFDFGRGKGYTDQIFKPMHPDLEDAASKKKVLAEFGLADISACFVDHTQGSAAAVFEWPSSLKIAYSGDCRPSRTFSNIGRGAHLLIHECTFDDERRGDAIAKKHSTMSEALRVAVDMRAERVMLTHFSQRYPKTAVMGEQSRKIVEGKDMSVLFGYDGMRVKLGDFWKAERFVPALQKLYEDEMD